MRARSGSLALRVLPSASGADESVSGNALLTFDAGDGARVRRDAGTGVPVATMPCPSLGPHVPLETWALEEGHAADPEEVRGGPFVARRLGAFLAGAATFDADPLEDGTDAVYRALFELLDTHGMHLVRVWNAVPRIGERALVSGTEMDRYMRFCRARSRAFESAFGTGFDRHLSAASAVGAQGEHGLVAFLAAREPGRRVSNPRQEEAWRYPARYGPRSPSFARATRLSASSGGGLLVSGTASIVGSESLHVGDLDGQLVETVSNLEAVLRAAGIERASRPLEALDVLRVYVKDPSHLHALRRGLLPLVRSDAVVHWQQAAICRPELLVEIEGVALSGLRRIVAGSETTRSSTVPTR